MTAAAAGGGCAPLGRGATGSAAWSPAICSGSVIHRRFTPVAHAFRYPAFFLRLPLTWLDGGPEAGRPRLFSVDRFNLFSLMRRDYGPRDGSALAPWIRGLLLDNDLPQADGEVVLYTLPRVLGHAFNPVSFWMCHDRAGRLRAVLCEVSNTFGERHNYLVARPDGGAIGTGMALQARKVFHVSPFFPVDGEYVFRFHADQARCLFRIDYQCVGVPQLETSLSGAAARPTDFGLLSAFLRLPWLMAGVIVRIHLQAFRLWLKGAVFHRKPLPPVEATTRSATAGSDGLHQKGSTND